MPTGADLVALARTKVGERYVLGARADLANPAYAGPWDCAEIASWVVYRVTGHLFGCSDNDAPVARAEPYSGGWARDAKAAANVSVESARFTVGAILVRAPGEGGRGHVALSAGDGRTVEAHSTARGVCESSSAGRRWDYGFLVPGVSYEVRTAPRMDRLLRVTSPRMGGADVREVQGYLGVAQDGVYGPGTAAAVVAWQNAHGLTPDGEVGPMTWAAMRRAG